MPRPLLVNAAELLRRPGSVREVDLQLAPGELGIDDDRLVRDAPLDVRLRLESLSDGIVVEGTLGMRWRATCRRCLTPLDDRTDTELHELYQVELTDPDAFPIVGDQLDLEPMVRESVLLDLPDGPLCRPDCAGLCPVCGIDRNTGSCSCDTSTPDPRWAALDELRAELDET